MQQACQITSHIYWYQCREGTWLCHSDCAMECLDPGFQGKVKRSPGSWIIKDTKFVNILNLYKPYSQYILFKLDKSLARTIQQI